MKNEPDRFRRQSVSFRGYFNCNPNKPHKKPYYLYLTLNVGLSA